MIDTAVAKLVRYAEDKGLIASEDHVWAANTLLEALHLDSYTEPVLDDAPIDLPAVLDALMDDAHARGVLENDSIVYRDLFDTALMGRLTPPPREVIAKFRALYAEDPVKATDWYYRFSQDTNYIRRDRIAKDVQWKAPTEYGELDITINLSKPEKDPKAIAAARNLPSSAYPQCQLCATNEGYAGRVNHPARQNHRIVPIEIDGQPWFLQYSPYVYYNEHCICLNSEHTPMKIAGNPLGNIFLGYLVETEDAAGMVLSDFPVLNWLLFPVSGYVFGRQLLHARDKTRFYMFISPICIMITAVYFTVGIRNGSGMFGEGQITCWKQRPYLMRYL